MGQRYSIEREYVEYLDEVAEESYNSNSTQALREILDVVQDAEEATGKGNPVESVQHLLNEYDGYDGAGNYDADEYDITLSRERVAELIESDPVPPINPDHVPPEEVTQLTTWHKAGLLAGMLRYQYDDAKWDDGDEARTGFTKLKLRYCGDSSRLQKSSVRLRYEESVPSVKWLETDNDPNEWIEIVEFILDKDPVEYAESYASNSIDDDNDTILEKLEWYEEEGKEILRALEDDYDERADCVEELLDNLAKFTSKIHRSSEVEQ